MASPYLGGVHRHGGCCNQFLGGLLFRGCCWRGGLRGWRDAAGGQL